MTTLRPMTEPEFAAWLAQAMPAYAADKVASGQWSQQDSIALSAKEHEELLPQGQATPDNHLYVVVDANAVAVGMLWFAVQTRFDARVAYVYDVEVLPERRREGHAKRAFVALESEARRLGLSGIALHVFGHNQAARALYAGLGFEPTNISLFKTVAATPA